MPEQITIKEVWNPDSPEPYQGQNGMTYSYKLTLEDGRFATIAQKADTPAPYPGQVLEGEMRLLKEGGKMHRLSNVKRNVNGASPAPSQTTSQPSLQPASNYEVLDLTQRLIIRQNALNRALEFAIASKKLEVLDNDPRPGMTIDAVIELRVEYFESLIWRAASKGHEQKVLGWADVVPAQKDDAPSSRPEGLPDASAEVSGGPAPAGTLARILKAKRENGVDDLVFSTFLTSIGVENINGLGEVEAQVVLAWLTEGQEMAA